MASVSGGTAHKNSDKKGTDMEFLREILGEELYKQLETAINAHNGNEANREKQIKIANLGSGEYVGRGKYDALNELLASKQTELDTANGLIADLKKGTKGNEELQGKIAAHEQQVQQLQQQLQETKVKAAVKVALLSEKAVDVDYLTYKINEKLKADGKTLELDENENIKGWADMIAGLKTQYPAQFETSKGGVKVDEFKLPDQQNGVESMTKSELLRKPYKERAEFARDNPDAYAAIMKN